MINQKQLINVLIGVFVGTIFGVSGMVLRRQVQPAPIQIIPPDPTVTPAPTPTLGPIQVYVNGAVANPDIYELPPDSIVEAAIEMAGGFSDGANTAVINLAQPLADGVQVFIPFEEKDTGLPHAGVNEPDIVVESRMGSGLNFGGLININTADIALLDTLPGIGPSTAQKIVDYRDANGSFSSLEELMNVSGIGEAKFNQVKDAITVEE
ncbi:MAG: ComEA family DNA-binding protein [Chloroflexi bacterium]|nr:MAG: ComEA family DNA-binding protein [Chloroflexota bacterium]